MFKAVFMHATIAIRPGHTSMGDFGSDPIENI